MERGQVLARKDLLVASAVGVVHLVAFTAAGMAMLASFGYVMESPGPRPMWSHVLSSIFYVLGFPLFTPLLFLKTVWASVLSSLGVSLQFGVVLLNSAVWGAIAFVYLRLRGRKANGTLLMNTQKKEVSKAREPAS